MVPSRQPLPTDDATLRELRGIERAWSSSAFLRRTVAARTRSTGAPDQIPDEARAWLEVLARHAWTAESIEARFGQLAYEYGAGARMPNLDAPVVGRALRLLRQELLSAQLVRECAGSADLAETTRAMTAFAELAVRESLRVLVPELAGSLGIPVDADGVPQDLVVFAMGKAGSAELNVSSDLDLVFACREPAGLRAPADGGGIAPSAAPHAQQFFDRLGRRLIALLDAHEPEGIVFRIDMRLRPHGEDGPLVPSAAMLEEYFVREGREWERFAWAKARVISAAVLSAPEQFAAQCRALEAAIQPFVYRKYFDFGAIGSIRELHQRIRAETRKRSNGHYAHERDVKLGRGGIREIEFLAQTFCIMRGGRDPRLRIRGTQDTLRAIAERALLPRAQCEELLADYVFLRRVEHALQWREDAQTHLLPASPQAQAEAATLLGIDSAEALGEKLRQTTRQVAHSFDAIFPTDPDPRGAPDAGIEAADLAHCGFADPAAGALLLHELLEAPRSLAMSPGLRASMRQLAGAAVRLIGAQARHAEVGTGADGLLLRWIRLIEVIGGRSTYVALLLEYPGAHERVIRLLATGGWASDYLLRHPILLDELVERPGADLPPDAGEVYEAPGSAEPYWRPWRAQVEEELRHAPGDVERQMNQLRDAHHVQVFRLLLADLGGAIRLERLADHLSALADAVLALVLEAAWRSMDLAGRPAPPLAIVAYGKLGGRELGYASDLDLAFVYEEGSGAQEADENARLCTQLVRRVISWLSTATSSGRLFEIDLRLRPNGSSGLLVTPMPAFERYQRNADGHGAWVWEHQALTRARACAGDAALCARIEQIRVEVLRQARDPQALAREVLAMRQRMLEGHANDTALFDLKHDRGGMVDIEFIVQFLVLAYAREKDELLVNRGNIGLLADAAALGLIDAAMAREAAAAYRRYRQLQHALRLVGAERARVEIERVQAHVDAVLRLWREVFVTDEPLPAHTGARR
jgi:[glutamine synthetase] adenylyltransferase / [glutamine synthetase]-adenylyl-L-tyrosine phosphorylase